MKKRDILEYISQENLDQMIPCFNPIKKSYLAGETILTYAENAENAEKQVAVLRSGNAKLELLDEYGYTFLMGIYEAGDIFGDLFSLPIDNYEYIVTAETDCVVLYIDYNHIIKPCSNLCDHHSQLISNLFVISAQKSQELSLHISLLGQSNIRNKILAYFNYAKNAFGVDRQGFFQIPMTLSDLAAYLHIARSAMMRELRQMRIEGIIDGGKSKFKLLK